MNEYITILTCTTVVPAHHLDEDDRYQQPQGTYTATVKCANGHDAREAAINRFHNTIPISMLENYSIDVVVYRLGDTR